MSAERLRAAANRLREVASEVDGRPEPTDADMDAIAAWDVAAIFRTPVVALALAGWLSEEASRVESGARSITFDGAPMFPPNPQALALAGAILGDE